jgi:thioredoxin-related protein
MKIAILALLSLLGTCAFAAKVGDSYDQVLAEKGKPVSQVVAGNLCILNYADGSIRLKDNVVVEIKSVEAARGPLTRTDPVATVRSRAKPAASPSASDSDWNTDYRSALARAETERRYVFLFFTGSDWCGWCKRLDEEILSTQEFRSHAAEKLILVKLDFPRHTEQSEELRKQNGALARRYRISGYPTVIILDPTGRAVKSLGYQEGGPGPFIEALRSVEQ